MSLQVLQGFDIDKVAVLQDFSGSGSLFPAVFEHQPASIDQQGLSQLADCLDGRQPVRPRCKRFAWFKAQVPLVKMRVIGLYIGRVADEKVKLAS